MATHHSDPLHEKHTQLLYQLLSLRDEAMLQNDLYNTSNVEIILNKMEALLLDALEERANE